MSAIQTNTSTSRSISILPGRQESWACRARRSIKECWAMGPAVISPRRRFGSLPRKCLSLWRLSMTRLRSTTTSRPSSPCWMSSPRAVSSPYRMLMSSISSTEHPLRRSCGAWHGCRSCWVLRASNCNCSGAPIRYAGT